MSTTSPCHSAGPAGRTEPRPWAGSVSGRGGVFFPVDDEQAPAIGLGLVQGPVGGQCFRTNGLLFTQKKVHRGLAGNWAWFTLV